MIVLGIDPGSLKTGWGLIESSGNKLSYIDSGTLTFDGRVDYLLRVNEIQEKFDDLLCQLSPDAVAIESLIFKKSPTALIKLAQTRGVIIANCLPRYHERIFEYSPNLVKSTVTGHGHANKEGVSKVLDMLLGPRNYSTHDESDALAIAICHAMNYNSSYVHQKTSSKGKGFAASLSHKI